MALDTIIQSGRFTSTGTAKIIQLRSDYDWIYVRNETKLYSAAAGDFGVEYYWQKGMTNGRGIRYVKLGTGTDANQPITVSQIAANSGFFTIDSTDRLGTYQAKGGANEITAISTATPPVASNSGSNGLIAGDVVRLINVTGAPQFSGYDFTVGMGTLTAGTFSLDYAPTLAVAGGAAGYRVINFDPLYYPAYRYITAITKGATTVVKLSVTHQYKKGQVVGFKIPSVFSMVELDGLKGTITDVSTANNTITVNIDSSSFTAFSFPTAAQAALALGKAVVYPVGTDTGYALTNDLNVSSGAVYNTGYIGVKLAAGANSPAGQTSAQSGLGNNDVIYWTAGKAFSVTNE